jgi:hypothetical protein
MPLGLLTKLYHKDTGIPAGLPMPAPGSVLHYSRHALSAAKDDHLDEHELPPRLPDVFEVIDVTVMGGVPARWALRFPLFRNVEGKPTRTGFDLIIVVSYDYTVLTVYINADTDQHTTLRRERYIAQGA